MSEELQRLIQLQQLDASIVELRQRVLSIPDEIENQAESLQESHDAVEELREQTDRQARTQRRLEGEVDLLQQKLSRYQEQLMDVKTNREYKAMQLEIAGVREQISSKEDEILEIMLAMDELDDQTREARRRAEERALEVSSRQKELETFAAGSETNMADFEQERNRLERNLPEPLLEQYRRIASVNNGQALAPVSDESCQACNVTLRPQLFTEVKTGLKILTCETCNRILYYVPPNAISRSKWKAGPIWQAMKGDSEHPKPKWIPEDLKYQHFSRDTGQKFEKQIQQNDLMLIYWPGPGNRIYMGLQIAAEEGPYELPNSVPGADRWPYGLRVKSAVWIPDPQRGISHGIARRHVSLPQTWRRGLERADQWSGIDWLIEEIRKRGIKAERVPSGSIAKK
ncbi:MAG: C4-type zinc ribbon domain-containing protein [Acidobacteriota bacterium]|nr:C4-type zinc ribbon domain-containing protein [Acidobacteriota bacterium]